MSIRLSHASILIVLLISTVGGIVLFGHVVANASCSEGVSCSKKMCLSGDGLCSLWEWECANNVGEESELKTSCPAQIPTSTLDLSRIEGSLNVETSCFHYSTYNCGEKFITKKQALNDLEDVVFCPFSKKSPAYRVTLTADQGSGLTIYSTTNISRKFDDIAGYYLKSPEGEYIYPCYREGAGRISDFLNSIFPHLEEAPIAEQ